MAVTLPLRNVRDLVKSPMPGYLMVDYDVISVADEQVEGQTRQCIHISKRDANTNQQGTAQICFEPDSKQIASISAQGNFLNVPTDIELTAFKSLGVKRYPMHMTSTVATENMPPANIEANVETLENVTKFDGDPFTPPAGAAVRDWCSTLAAAPSLEDYDQPSFPQEELKNLSEFFVLVGADGRVMQAEPVRRGGRSGRRAENCHVDQDGALPDSELRCDTGGVRDVLHAEAEAGVLGLSSVGFSLRLRKNTAKPTIFTEVRDCVVSSASARRDAKRTMSAFPRLRDIQHVAAWGAG